MILPLVGSLILSASLVLEDTATLLIEMLPGVEALFLEKKAVKLICSVIVAVLVLLNFL
jgi:hypothetical protein